MMGERMAARYLADIGYRLLGLRQRTAYGEIDIVAESGDEVVFIEVKTRSGADYGRPEEAVGRGKRDHLRRSAAAWLASRRLADRRHRIDVITLEPDGLGGRWKLRHLVSAVGEE